MLLGVNDQRFGLSVRAREDHQPGGAAADAKGDQVIVPPRSGHHARMQGVGG